MYSSLPNPTCPSDEEDVLRREDVSTRYSRCIYIFNHISRSTRELTLDESYVFLIFKQIFLYIKSEWVEVCIVVKLSFTIPYNSLHALKIKLLITARSTLAVWQFTD